MARRLCAGLVHLIECPGDVLVQGIAYEPRVLLDVKPHRVTELSVYQPVWEGGRRERDVWSSLDLKSVAP